MTEIIQNQPVLDPYGDAELEGQAATSTNKNRLMTPFGIVIVVAVLLIGAMVVWGIYQNEQDTVNQGPAPNFSLKTYDGQDIRLSDFKDQNVVVINFWQTNCPPCHEEAPMLVRVYEDYRDEGVIFIGVNAKDPDKLALEYLDQYNIEYINGLDIGDKIQEMYRTTGYPETFVIDRNGEIVRHYPGQPSEISLRSTIDNALEQS
jgi:cytochrome c biogenesis protein CcmG/thiol:disulfide interchange protein DsbE